MTAAYSNQFIDALQFAATLHQAQWRKATRIPYLSHLMAVTALVWEDGGSEDEAIAALLHDAVEDQGGLPLLDEICSRFGDKVARIVLECSDTTEVPKPPWHQRKQEFVDRMRNADDSVLRVTAADKLHNSLATLEDLRTLGAPVWDRFKTGSDGFIWYHREMLAVLQARLPSSRSVALLASALAEIEAITKSSRRGD